MKIVNRNVTITLTENEYLAIKQLIDSFEDTKYYDGDIEAVVFPCDYLASFPYSDLPTFNDI